MKKLPVAFASFLAVWTGLWVVYGQTTGGSNRRERDTLCTVLQRGSEACTNINMNGFTISNGVFQGDGSGLTNVPDPSLQEVMSVGSTATVSTAVRVEAPSISIISTNGSIGLSAQGDVENSATANYGITGETGVEVFAPNTIFWSLVEIRSNVNMQGNRITVLGAPVSANDAARLFEITSAMNAASNNFLRIDNGHFNARGLKITNISTNGCLAFEDGLQLSSDGQDLTVNGRKALTNAILSEVDPTVVTQIAAHSVNPYSHTSFIFNAESVATSEIVMAAGGMGGKIGLHFDMTDEATGEETEMLFYPSSGGDGGGIRIQNHLTAGSEYMFIQAPGNAGAWTNEFRIGINSSADYLALESVGKIESSPVRGDLRIDAVGTDDILIRAVGDTVTVRSLKFAVEAPNMVATGTTIDAGLYIGTTDATTGGTDIATADYIGAQVSTHASNAIAHHGADDTLTTDGEITIDTTDNVFVFRGDSDRVLDPVITRSMNLPADDDWTDDLEGFATLAYGMASTLVAIEAAAYGASATSLTFSVIERTAGNWDSGGSYLVSNQVADVDGLLITNGFIDASIAARSKLFVEVTAEVGTVDNLLIDVHFKKDRE